MIAIRAGLRLRPGNRRRTERRRFEWPRVDWARARAAIVGLAALAGLALTVAFALNRPVRTVEMAGSFERVQPAEVESVVRERLGGGFVTADLAALQAAIAALPWVDHARVQRRWPEGLHVQVTEQVAAARWGASGLLNTRGELFVAHTRHVPPELPQLAGPAGTESQVAGLYFRIYPRLQESGLRVTGLRLDARGAWEFDLANGVTVRLGRRQVDERVERFIAVGAPLVAARASDIAYVDLRYSNGFSIGWRTVGMAQSPVAVQPPALQRDFDQDA